VRRQDVGGAGVLGEEAVAGCTASAPVISQAVRIAAMLR
jgi:hypothetical protein